MTTSDADLRAHDEPGRGGGWDSGAGLAAAKLL
jgi:hypothetical protein